MGRGARRATWVRDAPRGHSPGGTQRAPAWQPGLGRRAAPHPSPSGSEGPNRARAAARGNTRIRARAAARGRERHEGTEPRRHGGAQPSIPAGRLRRSRGAGLPRGDDGARHPAGPGLAAGARTASRAASEPEPQRPAQPSPSGSEGQCPYPSLSSSDGPNQAPPARRGTARHRAAKRPRGGAFVPFRSHPVLLASCLTASPAIGSSRGRRAGAR